VPAATDATTSTACTTKNAVGVRPDHDRGSAQIPTARRGQISHVHTPNATRNADHRRDSTTAIEYACS